MHKAKALPHPDATMDAKGKGSGNTRQRQCLLVPFTVRDVLSIALSQRLASLNRPALGQKAHLTRAARASLEAGRQ